MQQSAGDKIIEVQFKWGVGHIQVRTKQSRYDNDISISSIQAY